MAILGVGGIFFRANDPGALRAWYAQHFGLPTGYDPFEQSAGPLVFMPFPKDTDHFPADRAWMVNFRVQDMAETLAGLRQAGIAVTTKPEWDTPETGRFGRLHDPEGNQIELWEPPAD
jgi:predicted enzyme related to lactoylglutathione lyase